MQSHQIIENLSQIAAKFAGQRTERQQRRHLEKADFDLIAEAGFLQTGIAAADGGLWTDVQQCIRPYAAMIHTIAMGDPSVALVSAMHPCVLIFWIAAGKPPQEAAPAWQAQVDWITESVRQGAWWGTVTSEPGSGGDIMQSQSIATPTDKAGHYLLTGEKHFGSGSGMSNYMMTTARAVGEKVPELFILEIADIPWDGSEGVTLAAEWDGHGMSATQSHAFKFENFPAIRSAWAGGMASSGAAAGPIGNTLFTAVIVAIVDQAIQFARQKLVSKADKMRPYERVEWVRAENEAWLIRQAYEGMINTVESSASGIDGVIAAARGKATVAELSESCLGRLSKVVGGASFSRSSPLGRWAQDVRALGFLRPPWGLAYDNLFNLSFPKQDKKRAKQN
ncbi:MAG: acyl-CoA dehydrogenase family protein [Pseudomonadales bacterium]|nr:acyl-CoA dehydrogenase family protein [Pseudomonadales bacterium]